MLTFAFVSGVPLFSLNLVRVTCLVLAGVSTLYGLQGVRCPQPKGSASPRRKS